MNFLHPSGLVRDLLLLLARIGLGVVFLAHGLQKLVSNGMEATTQGFVGMEIPLPTAAAWFAALVETVGGAALILGALTPVFAALLTIDMIGALLLVHLPNGLWVDEGGYELVLALAAGSLALVAVGAGRLSVDGVLAPKAAGRRDARRVSA